MPRPPRPHGHGRAREGVQGSRSKKELLKTHFDGRKGSSSSCSSQKPLKAKKPRTVISRSFVDTLRCGRRATRCAAVLRQGVKRRFGQLQDEEDVQMVDLADVTREGKRHFLTDSDSPHTPSPRSVSLEVRSSGRSVIFVRNRNCKLPPLSPSCGAHQGEEDYSLFFGEHFSNLCNGEDRILKQPAHFDYAPVIPNDQDQMRKAMLDRIVRLHLKFDMKPESLYLAVSLIDECLMLRLPCIRPFLLAPVALLVAAKFEEVLAPDLTGRALIEAAGEYATQAEFEAAELRLLRAVEYRMHRPTPFHHRDWFVEYVHNYEGFGERKEKVKLASAFICELALLSEAAGRWAPTLHAAATVMIAGTMFGRPGHALQKMAAPSERRLHQLRVILRSICSLFTEPGIEKHAIYQKYAGEDWSSIAVEVQQMMTTV